LEEKFPLGIENEHMYRAMYEAQPMNLVPGAPADDFVALVYDIEDFL
jgi:hypothetical protein